jgi:hypothetical protein
MVGLAAWGQTVSFETPVLGHAFDAAAGSIRPILGVPGAAWFEAPLPSEEALGEAALAPGRDYALAVTGGRLRIVRWAGGVVSSRPFAALAALPERVAFSPTGAAVALYAGGAIETWSGMPEAPNLTRWIEHHGPVDALAVADDGAAVAVAVAGAVHLYDSGGSRIVAEGGRISGLAFAPNSHALAVADLERDRVLVTGAGAGSWDFEKPSGVAFSADGRKLAVASAARSAAGVIDRASGQSLEAACECGVETLARARGNAVFRLNESAKGHAPMLDGDGAEPRIVFIAAGEEAK